MPNIIRLTIRSLALALLRMTEPKQPRSRSIKEASGDLERGIAQRMWTQRDLVSFDRGIVDFNGIRYNPYSNPGDEDNHAVAMLTIGDNNMAFNAGSGPLADTANAVKAYRILKRVGHLLPDDVTPSEVISELGGHAIDSLDGGERVKGQDATLIGNGMKVLHYLAAVATDDGIEARISAEDTTRIQDKAKRLRLAAMAEAAGVELLVAA